MHSIRRCLWTTALALAHHAQGRIKAYANWFGEVANSISPKVGLEMRYCVRRFRHQLRAPATREPTIKKVAMLYDASLTAGTVDE